MTPFPHGLNLANIYRQHLGLSAGKLFTAVLINALQWVTLPFCWGWSPVEPQNLQLLLRKQEACVPWWKEVVIISMNGRNHPAFSFLLVRKLMGKEEGWFAGACKNVTEVKLRVRFFVLSITSSWPFLGGTLFNTYSRYLWETSSCIGVGYFQHFKGFSTFLLEKISLEPSLS